MQGKGGRCGMPAACDEKVKVGSPVDHTVIILGF